MNTPWYTHFLWIAAAAVLGFAVSGILEVQAARVRYAPAQRFLSAEEIASLFIQFRSEHPIFSRMVARIPGWNIDSTYDEFLELARTLRGVAFTPRAG